MKKGFTLIELMVVIVIIGVLASVGVPKLTSVIAKSKASEVPVAASAYIKLQDAYVIEHKKVGSWKRIGYSAPKSDNFKYDKETLSKGDQAGELGIGWKAENLVGLANCLAGNRWTVRVISLGTDGENKIRLAYKSEVTSSDCAVLMSGWGVVDGG